MNQEDLKEAQRATRIEPLAIQEEYIGLPGHLAYWNNRYAAALEAALRAEHERKMAESRVLLELRAAAKVEGTKPTVDEIEARVALSQDVRSALLDEIAAQAEKARVQGVVEAIRAKREMLVSLGAHLREEMRGDPSIRSEELRKTRENRVG